jgi:hypothetical protein
MFYCFVQQRYSDSNFFRLDDPARIKSRDAIRFVCGFYSDRLSALTQRLEKLRQTREANDLSVEQLLQVFKEVSGGADLLELEENERSLAEELLGAEKGLRDADHQYRSATHIVDEMRDQLRSLSSDLSDGESALLRQRQRMDELEALRAEFFSLKFKTERSQVALAVLGEAEFHYCPQCSRELEPAAEGSCRVCKSDTADAVVLSPQFLEASRRDLNDRIGEIDVATERHSASMEREERRVSRLREEKAVLDAQLSDAVQRYDADYVSRMRQSERVYARLASSLRELRQLLSMHRRIVALRRDTSQMDAEIRALRLAIEDEQLTLVHAQMRVRNIETAFLTDLKAIGVPGVDPDDRAIINTRTWFPRIQSSTEAQDYWDFDSSGSNGRRVLFVICYALAVHQVAEQHALPLPSILLLDTPTKDVSRDVNALIHDAVNSRIYDLARTDLRETQLIVADASFLEPPADLDVKTYIYERDAGLISYYQE